MKPTDTSPVQPLRSILCKAEPRKAEPLISVSAGEKVTVASAGHSSKADVPIVVTFERSMEVRPACLNDSSPRLVTDAGRVMDLRAVQPLKHPSLMASMLALIVTVASDWQL